MTFLELLRKESSISLRNIVLLASIAGLSNAGILALVNTSAARAAKGENSLRFLLIFVIVILVYVFAQKYILKTSTREIETILHRIRVRLADKIRHSDLEPLEDIGRARLYAGVNKHTVTISQASLGLIVASQFGGLILFAALYVAFLSMVAFLLTTVFCVLLVFVNQRRTASLAQQVEETNSRENKLFDNLSHFLDGFKQVRMNTKRSEDLFRHFEEISDAATRLKIRTQSDISEHFIFSQVSVFLLLAVVVFVIPQFSQEFSSSVVQTTTAVLFLVGPIGGLVSTIPLMQSVNQATESLHRLEEDLDQSAYRPPNAGAEELSIDKVIFEDVFFQYDDPQAQHPFSVGPINFEIGVGRRDLDPVPPGEIVFIRGGNGSGKSTVLKLLTALYYPREGRIRINGRSLGEADYEAYRNLFSVIFTDYRLFERLYGLRNVDSDQVAGLLEDFDLADKTALVNGEWETLDLSDGQKKRLALLVSLLEDKQIYVFDEWAADQDPEFRKKFYRQILPEMKKSGKTIIAATHDDRYFNAADRLLKMEEGRFIDVTNDE